MGTPTYPYTFLVGHEDKDLVHRLKITAFSDKPLVIPNECCSDTAQFRSTGGIFLDMQPYQPNGGLSFVVGSLAAKARETSIVIRPAAELYGNVKLTLRLTDGNFTALSTITIFVNNRPQLDKFCAYDVLQLDSLGSIADMFGMHWMTIFMMNNHTLTHPDNLSPGTRLSIGRPYIVKKSDSLYRCRRKCLFSFIPWNRRLSFCPFTLSSVFWWTPHTDRECYGWQYCGQIWHHLAAYTRLEPGDRPRRKKSICRTAPMPRSRSGIYHLPP